MALVPFSGGAGRYQLPRRTVNLLPPRHIAGVHSRRAGGLFHSHSVQRLDCPNLFRREWAATPRKASPEALQQAGCLDLWLGGGRTGNGYSEESIFISVHFRMLHPQVPKED